MFDEKPPEDIFAGTEKPGAGAQPVAPARPPAKLPPPIVQAAPPPQMYALHSSRGTGLKTAIMVIVALLAIGGAAYLAYAFMIKAPASTIVDTGTPADTGSPETTLPPVDTTTPTETPAASPTFLDSDGDGLTNAEELDAGTSATNPDTDADGLGDREEVKVYGTDPRRSDTDGDGFLDGAEVKAGYNPNGPGKLLEVPTNGS